MPKINCAIYTRKSTEHGLDMEFNSLQNQEESGKAYILSQAFNGWEYVKTYSDGGISGGTMERPGLQALLNDIREGHIQVVVVYKVDRLSRSIIDFHKMMQEFDKYGCNFVSITQSFDTSNSMGKLTLNMLLSFAQFEREVSAERVRDKIAASKAKGLWMGGTPPLGYDLKDKQLIPNPKEAELVNLIFNKYLELENMLAVAEWLKQNDYHTKCWMPRGGQLRGGKAFQKSSIQRILTNPVYIGKVVHHAQNKVYMGRHKSIVPKNVWEAVQDTVRRRITSPHAFSLYQTHQTVLAGKLYDDKGQVFRLTSSNKKGKKFLYYYNGVGGRYLSVEQLDSFVLKTLKMTDFDDWEPLANREGLTAAQIKKWVVKVVCQSTDKTHYLSIFLDEKQIKADLSACPRISGQAESRTLSAEKLDGRLYVRNSFVVDNVSSVKLQNGTARNILTVRQLNESLVRGLSRGWQLKRLLEKGKSQRACEAASGMNKRTFARYLNLCYLSPKVVTDILEYRNPRNMTLKDLMTLAEAETEFREQEKGGKIMIICKKGENMKKIIYIFILALLGAACSSAPKRPSLSQLQQFASEVVIDFQEREKEGTLSQEEQEEWKRLQDGMNSEEMLSLKKHSAQPINLDFPFLVAGAKEWGYSFEEINDFLGLDLIVKNPYCEDEFKSYKVFQVLSEHVLAEGCEVTNYDKCSTSHGRIFMFLKQGEELYFDNKILTPPAEFCSVYAGTYSYESNGGLSHTVPVVMFFPKTIDKVQLEHIQTMREESQKELK